MTTLKSPLVRGGLLGAAGGVLVVLLVVFAARASSPCDRDPTSTECATNQSVRINTCLRHPSACDLEERIRQLAIEEILRRERHR